MKIKRSSKCSLKFTTESKKLKLQRVLEEYGTVVNHFIDLFWEMEQTPKKGKLLKPIVDSPENTWLSARLRKVAAREAIDMVLSAKNKTDARARTFKPHHYGKSMSVSSTIANLMLAKKAKTFDCWLHLASMGEKIILDLPIKLHDHFHKWNSTGRRLNSYIIHLDYVQFCFEVETGRKKTQGTNVGLDSGINSLATLDDGTKLGEDIKGLVEQVKQKKHGSKGQKRARRALRQRMDEVAKELFATFDMKTLVVEDLKKMNYKTKVRRRLTKNIRRSLGIWTYRYWLQRLQRASEDNRVSFRRVSPWYTSQTCNRCDHTERANRVHGDFLCQSCGHSDDADVNAAKNILSRWARGPYGAAYKPSGRNLVPSG